MRSTSLTDISIRLDSFIFFMEKFQINNFDR
jgi:hypothetical protein